MGMRRHTTPNTPYAGLSHTRKSPSKKMDARVKPAYDEQDGCLGQARTWRKSSAYLRLTGCESLQKSLSCGHAENIRTTRRKTRCRQSPRQGRSHFPGRRFLLYFPRLSCAAAAQSQV